MAQAGLMTLQDIADLARVRRHVVTMWRARPRVRGRMLAFPQPVSSERGVDYFDSEQIVTYLEESGRGKNDEAREDAPASAVPDDVATEDVVVLLCLHTLGGSDLDGLTHPELVAAALAVDPEDRALLREIRAAEPTPAVARYVDDLMAASFGPADALSRLDLSRLRRREGERGLTGDAVALLGAVVSAARTHVPSDAVALVPPDDGRLTASLAEGFAGVSLPSEARAARRRVLIEGLELVDDVDQRVHLLTLVGNDEEETLERADELTVSLEPGDVGIVLGAASVLCDPLVEEPARRRAQTLGSGNLVMALRLPRGLWKAAHRQSLALWILVGAADPERAVCLADLENVNLDLDDLASDVLGALQGTARRAFRYARRVSRSAVMVGAEVLPRGVRATSGVTADPASHLERIHAAALVTSVGSPGFDIPVAPAPGGLVLRQRSLGELVESKLVRVLRGNRIDAERADPAGTVSVLSADGRYDGVQLDPFDAAQIYRRATRTDRGDVVFVDGPTPRARVDTVGGSLVATPSRVLRLEQTAPIGPRTLAAIINEGAAPGSEWQTWSVPDLQPAERAHLETALGEAAEHQDALRARLAALHDLINGLVRGVAAGAVTLDPLLTDPKAG